MSSKSRKQSSPPRRSSSNTPQGSAGGKGAIEGDVEHAEPSHQDFIEAEELLKTPEGRNPLVYAGLILMLVFLMLVFLLPPSMLSGQSSKNPVVMRYTHPTRGPVELRETEFRTKANAFGRLLSFFGQRNGDTTQFAQFMILDQLALENGVTFSDEELKAQMRGYIEQGFGGNPDLFYQRLGRFPGGAKGFQETLRSMQRVNRYQSLLGKLTAIPEATEIESAWDEQFLEYAFEYVYSGSEDFVDAARAESPDDATLEAWFGERPESERNALKAPERFDAKVVGFVLDQENGVNAGEELLAAYPNAEDWDEEVQADAYYKRYSFTRFGRPEDPENTETPSSALPIYDYEEVRDLAARESRLLDSMTSFRADLQERMEAGETIDLVAEAAQLGLAQLADGVPRSTDEWGEAEGLGGRFTGSQMFGLGDVDSITNSPAVTEDGLVLVQLVERIPSELPPFAEIRETILEDWVEDRSGQLAEAALEDLAKNLNPKPEMLEDGMDGDEMKDTMADGDMQDHTADGMDSGDEAGMEDGDVDDEQVAVVTSEAFAAAAVARGLEVERRDWLQRGAKEFEDPLWDEPGHEFLRTRSDIYQLEVGELSEPLLNLDKSGAYLVLLVGDRQVPIEKMTPTQYQSLVGQASFAQSLKAFGGGGQITVEDLREKFGLWLLSDENREVETDADES